MRLLPALQRLKTVHPCGSALSRRTSIQLLNDGLTDNSRQSLNKWARGNGMQCYSHTAAPSGESLTPQLRQSLRKLKAQALLFSKISNSFGK